jgi:chromosome partitioning protein
VKCIAVINQKGGVGKTTTTVNLGAGLAQQGQRVLLVDLDPQANLTLHVDCQPELGGPSITQLFVDDQPLKAIIRPTTTPGLSVVPSDTSLGGVEQVLANKIGRETLLREAMAAYDGEPFDYALLDCPPSLGVLSANALVAADEVLIPMQAEYFSLQGMAKLTEVIELVRRRLNPALAILCVLPCMLDVRTRLTGEVLGEIRRHFGDLVARNPIRTNVKLAEAPSFGRSIFEHDPECNGARDYRALAEEVLERHGRRADAAPAVAAAAPAGGSPSTESEPEPDARTPAPTEPAREAELG